LGSVGAAVLDAQAPTSEGVDCVPPLAVPPLGAALEGVVEVGTRRLVVCSNPHAAAKRAAAVRVTSRKAGLFI